MADKLVDVVLPDGTAGTAPEAAARKIVSEGGRVLSAQEAAQAKADTALAEKYDPAEHPFDALAGQAESNVAAIYRGLTFGMSDLAAAKLGGDAARQKLLELQQAHPLSSAGLEMAGQVGSFAAGGESLGLGKAATGLGGTLLRGAGEGAIANVGSTISESALKNHDLTGEALVASGIKGAAIGAALSGGLYGASKLASIARRPTPAAYDALSAGQFGDAAPGFGKTVHEEVRNAVEETTTHTTKRSGFDTAADAYINARPGTSAEEASKLGEAWTRRTEVLSKHANTLENASRDFSTALNDALAAGRKTDMGSFGEAKVNQMSKLVDQSKFDEQASRAIDWLTDAEKSVKAFETNASKTTKTKWDWHVQNVTNAIESGESIQLHSALDSMKRFMGKEAKFGSGPFGLSNSAREFDELYQGENGLQKVLEEPIWGEKAANAQKQINAATAAMLSEGKLFTRKFTTEYGSELGRPQYVADTAAVSGFMNRLTSAANDLDAKGVDAWIATRQRFLDSVEKNYAFDTATNKAIATERAALEKLKSVHGQTTRDVALTNQVRAALEKERAASIGGMLGLVVDAQTKPYTMLQRLASLEETTQTVLKRSESSTKTLVHGTPAPQQPPRASGTGFFSSLLKSAPSGLGEPARAAAVSGSVRLREEFDRRAKEIRALQGKPDVIADRVEKALGTTTAGAPKVAASATATAMRGLDYLASALPPSRKDPYSLQPQLPAKAGPSDADSAKFMRVMSAVDDPLSVLREAKNGTLTPDHVQALKVVYPALYDNMRQQVMSTLMTSKSELPYSRRIQLGILLDLPTDATLAPDFLQAIQATYTAEEKAGEEPPPPNVSPLKAGGSSLMTPMQSAVQEGLER